MPKKSSRERILDAAEAVALEHGATHMTMNAVAARAGVSKGGLLYHFPSQRELLRAMLCRFMEHVESRRLRVLGELRGKACAELKAYLRAWLSLGQEDQRTAAALLATATREPQLVAMVRDKHRAVWAEIAKDVPRPEHAQVLALAVEGMWLSELLGVSPLSAGAKQRIGKILLGFTEEWCGGGAERAAAKRKVRR